MTLRRATASLPQILLLAGLALTLLATFTALPAHRTAHAAVTSVPRLTDPDKACATCHQAIYAGYERTAMARGSGMAADALIPGGFHHEPSGVDYRVYKSDGSLWMSYSRPATDPRGSLSGRVELAYFVGSNLKGRTYLYRDGQQWYELPINYYSRRAAYDMAPAYDAATAMPAPLPTDANCLHCHASFGSTPLSTAHNAFAEGPFAQGGIGCSGCHGDPAAHLAANGHGPITNPGKLSPARRDSACIQCHLEGDAVVYRPGKSLAQFVPGDDLNDYAVYFVRASQQSGGARATSQYEALLHSACKRAVGDAMTCTTCHDPHSEPAPKDRVAYYRARCLSCHQQPAMANHHPEQPDCARCHMPSRDTADISHEQVVDHDIERLPARHLDKPSSSAQNALVPVGSATAGDREYGLAYSQTAARNFPGAAQSAVRYLSKAVASGTQDAEVDARLAYFLQISGDKLRAVHLYTQALQLDPNEPAAQSNLAVLKASSDQVADATALLEHLVHNDPSQTAAGLNLAWIQCRSGRRSQALETLHSLERLNPDDPQLRTFLATGTYGGSHCDLH